MAARPPRRRLARRVPVLALAVAAACGCGGGGGVAAGGAPWAYGSVQWSAPSSPPTGRTQDGHEACVASFSFASAFLFLWFCSPATLAARVGRARERARSATERTGEGVHGL